MEVANENRIEIVYTGRGLGKGNKITNKYLFLSDMKIYSFKRKLLNCSIGQVISVINEETSVKGPYEYVRKYDDAEKIGIWIAEDRANYTLYEANLEMKKVPKNEYETAVNVLTEIYSRLSGSQKNAFLFRLNEDIRKFKY